MLNYPWPGNTTELAHVLEQATLLAQGGSIRPHHLPQNLRAVVLPGAGAPRHVKSVEEAELDAILQAGWATGGRVTRMASLLGISRTTVWRRLRDAGIDPAVFKRREGAIARDFTKDVAP